MAFITWVGHWLAQWLNHRFAIRRENKSIVTGISNLGNNTNAQKDEILHKILSLIAKYNSQSITATPKRIAKDLDIDQDIILAYMWEYHNEQFITFNSGGVKPGIETPFFLSPKALETIDIVKKQITISNKR
ncbi:MAG: hypothetical protein JW786_06245 [Desulfobacterales bacterium]|nr:hypothetical protein [Desulfobacterales bacterium]